MAAQDRDEDARNQEGTNACTRQVLTVGQQRVQRCRSQLGLVFGMDNLFERAEIESYSKISSQDTLCTRISRIFSVNSCMKPLRHEREWGPVRRNVRFAAFLVLVADMPSQPRGVSRAGLNAVASARRSANWGPGLANVAVLDVMMLADPSGSGTDAKTTAPSLINTRSRGTVAEFDLRTKRSGLGEVKLMRPAGGEPYVVIGGPGEHVDRSGPEPIFHGTGHSSAIHAAVVQPNRIRTISATPSMLKYERL
jgi:hypothetical protein